MVIRGLTLAGFREFLFVMPGLVPGISLRKALLF
jgi:hypothetical protein